MASSNVYYEKTLDGFETQCMRDLLEGKTRIADVPYKYRNHLTYIEAHKFARTISNDKQRHDAYWKIASLLEKDVIQSEKEHDDEKTKYRCLTWCQDNVKTMSASGHHANKITHPMWILTFLHFLLLKNRFQG